MLALWVFLGGGLGSLARYGVSVGLENYKPNNFPIATLVANVLSCLVIGIVAYAFSSKFQSDEMKALILIGFCGGFSTFSTFSNETLQLMKNGQFAIAIANILISLVLCIAVLYAFSLSKK
ncbi:fluoride efflux transporter CrcB [Parvicella tangerina]|uniref:Fluoride-specific ion channel FluC n=1 Tax=Parvicella tangerina TaxID=2829795 RepID=A0A916JN73_9FLAO|nr:fluoride efflux transporter CrcB [Parvicella tangerina]CAG5081587.1 Putative fluoride ion transporter CrcB [Parvicella tangerina]